MIDISIPTTTTRGQYHQHQISLATIYSTQSYQFVCSAKSAGCQHRTSICHSHPHKATTESLYRHLSVQSALIVLLLSPGTLSHHKHNSKKHDPRVQNFIPDTGRREVLLLDV